jgi:hypothetical protein
LNTSVLSQGALEIYIKSNLDDVHMKALKKIYQHRMGYLKQITGTIATVGPNGTFRSPG